MGNKGIKFVGPVFDSSGYARAARDNILSLHRAGVSVTVTPHCFENIQKPFGSEEDRALLSSLVGVDIPYDIIISQLTPDMAVSHVEGNKYNIAYFAWESTVIHPSWVRCLNSMNEVWVPSDWNVEILLSNGVTSKVYKIPHSINISMFEDRVIEQEKDKFQFSDSTYLFYSMFQWQPRKNPEILLRSYFNSFSSRDDVALVLKTYVNNGLDQEQNRIANKIREIKSDMLLANEEYPKVFLIGGKLSDAEVAALHLRCDCLVSMHASEGWGLTPFEAGLAGNPVIATGATGNMEYMTPENSYPLDYQWEFVNGMSRFNGWYLGSGKWAAPNQVHASELMQYVFSHREEAAAKGLLLREDIKEKFNHGVIASMMKSRIGEIRSSFL